VSSSEQRRNDVKSQDTGTQAQVMTNGGNIRRTIDIEATNGQHRGTGNERRKYQRKSKRQTVNTAELEMNGEDRKRTREMANDGYRSSNATGNSNSKNEAPKLGNLQPQQHRI
jgi:hypothetical protein